MRARAHIGADGEGAGRVTFAQIARFGIVGLSGYLIDLAIFDLLVAMGDLDRLAAASLAFVVAVANNFFWNRRWTFAAGQDPLAAQAPRFIVVSCLALGMNLVVLELLIRGGIGGGMVAQALATLAAIPLNFLGNRFWAFA